MAATAMIDRLIHHAEILSLKGDSYRLRGKDLGRVGKFESQYLTGSVSFDGHSQISQQTGRSWSVLCAA